MSLTAVFLLRLNIKMERIYGEIKDREIRDKENTMRRQKIKETSILKGMQVFHNFIKCMKDLKERFL